MYKPVSYEKMNPVQLALANVDIHLSSIHGILLEDKEPSHARLNIEVHKLVEEAIEWLINTNNDKDNCLAHYYKKTTH